MAANDTGLFALIILFLFNVYLVASDHIVNSTREYFIATSSYRFNKITGNSTINNCNIICSYYRSCYILPVNTTNGTGNINLHCEDSRACAGSNVITTGDVTIDCLEDRSCDSFSCNASLCTGGCALPTKNQNIQWMIH